MTLAFAHRMERKVENQSRITIETLTATRSAELAKLGRQLVRDLIQEHQRLRQFRRADPPSDARFAQMVGLKADAYAKVRRGVDVGRAPRLSRRSLAAIVLSDAIPEDLRARAHHLLWLTFLRGIGACREMAQLREALFAPAYFADLANAGLPTVVEGRDARPES